MEVDDILTTSTTGSIQNIDDGSSLNENELDSPLLTFISLCATIITISLFIVPFKTIQNIIKTKNTGSVAGLQFISSLLNNFLWICYGSLTNNKTMFYVNSTGILFSVYYVYNYWFYSTPALSKIYFKKIVIAISIGFIILFISFYGNDIETSKSRLGFLSSVVCVLMFAAPLEKMLTVIQTRNSDGMLKGVAILSLACGISWTIFGLLIVDIYVYLPNILASILSSLQYSLIIKYPPKSLPK
ncbi:hypothetical protein CYY_004659 [Polysphondylium violaceum]|uniref:Sugar transporter SWEET n=1 Tax=Polysphondylium violaceum TaxID=133409 RepID=A0A8J4PVN0_9MYCE|nr:hypothetical protein CYY_004659 [Polysphondylium violaceum]